MMQSPQTDTSSTMKKSWSSRSIGSQLQHSIFYALIRLGGRRAAYLLLVFVVLYYVLFRPAVRNRSRHYLSRRFPGRNPLARLWGSYRITLELGKILVDRAVLGILGPGQLSISLSGRKELQKLLAEGNGLVLVTAHAGSWQVAMAALGFIGAPVNMLMHREDGDIDRHYFELAGQASPYNIIDPAGFLGGTLEMMAALKRGEVLCIMGDRPMGSDSGTLAVDFLGAPVRLPVSPYKLAAATNAPLAVVFPYKTGPKSYALQLARVLRVPPQRGRSGEPYRPYVTEFVAALGAFVRDHPYQFFNFFDMWQTTPDRPAAPRQYSN